MYKTQSFTQYIYTSFQQLLFTQKNAVALDIKISFEDYVSVALCSAFYSYVMNK